MKPIGKPHRKRARADDGNSKNNIASRYQINDDVLIYLQPDSNATIVKLRPSFHWYLVRGMAARLLVALTSCRGDSLHPRQGSSFTDSDRQTLDKMAKKFVKLGVLSKVP